MRRKLEPSDYIFATAAIIGVGVIVLFGVSAVAKLIIHLIK
jgi:hypothetical protein